MSEEDKKLLPVDCSYTPTQRARVMGPLGDKVKTSGISDRRGSPCAEPPARRGMKRADLEQLKVDLAYKYAEQLERTHSALTLDQRAHMCVGFEHGLGWFLRTLEAAGFKVSDE